MGAALKRPKKKRKKRKKRNNPCVAIPPTQGLELPPAWSDGFTCPRLAAIPSKVTQLSNSRTNFRPCLTQSLPSSGHHSYPAEFWTPLLMALFTPEPPYPGGQRQVQSHLYTPGATTTTLPGDPTDTKSEHSPLAAPVNQIELSTLSISNPETRSPCDL